MAPPVPPAAYTASQIILLAMLDAGLVPEDVATPTPAQIALYLPRLNEVLNIWQTSGLKLWLQTDLVIPLVAGQAKYSIGTGFGINTTRPTKVIDQGYYVEADGQSQRPISLIGRDSYNSFGSLTNTGAINSYYVDKQRLSLDVYFWQVPDAQATTGSPHLIIQQQASNLVLSSDQIQFPPEWFIGLHWGLAAEICTGQPQSVIDRCETKAAVYKEMLDSWDVEDVSVMFYPDDRGYR